MAEVECVYGEPSSYDNLGTQQGTPQCEAHHVSMALLCSVAEAAHFRQSLVEVGKWVPIARQYLANSCQLADLPSRQYRHRIQYVLGEDDLAVPL